MSQTLPDEIVKEILDPLLKLSDVQFRYKPTSAPFSRNLSSSNFIAVSKQFCRVGTPLLYHTVGKYGNSSALRPLLTMHL